MKNLKKNIVEYLKISQLRDLFFFFINKYVVVTVKIETQYHILKIQIRVNKCASSFQLATSNYFFESSKQSEVGRSSPSLAANTSRCRCPLGEITTTFFNLSPTTYTLPSISTSIPRGYFRRLSFLNVHYG